MKPLEEIERAFPERQRMTEEVDRVLSQPLGLVGVGGEKPGGAGA